MRWLLLATFAALTTWPPARAAELSTKEQSEARKLYLTKCARCHKLYNPAKYDDDAWQAWMRKMNRKAKLKEAQAELLGRYLETFRRPQPANASATQPGR